MRGALLLSMDGLENFKHIEKYWDINNNIVSINGWWQIITIVKCSTITNGWWDIITNYGWDIDNMGHDSNT